MGIVKVYTTVEMMAARTAPQTAVMKAAKSGAEQVVSWVVWKVLNEAVLMAV
jgi:hypothetical protein